MTPERFQEVEKLYHAVREGSADQRAALLEQTDSELRYEVESLLSQHSSGEFLDRPALQNAPELREDAALDGLAAGTCLGPYRIESKLGEGGMGEIFRALDTRLGRPVAIKIARERFSSLFERERLAISSLNHPYICTVYDVGPNYLVMELVEGETIAALLRSGPLPVKTAHLYASQIVAALAEAHSKGIIHRDLKPRNIMIAKSGVKVLDFGLAKSGTDETATASHLVMGTPGYIAPEQREGKPVDARTDLYSFGCVLYEMLTGARVGSQRRRIPSRKLERIIFRCLEEDAERRWQSAGAIEWELNRITTAASAWITIPAAAVTLALSAAAYFYLHPAPRLTAKDTIVLGEFENKTGDPIFDQTLRHGLAVQLEQSPFLTLVSEQRIRQLLDLMSRPVGTRLTPDISQEICERAGGTAVLEGSITGLGNQYVLWLRASSCSSGTVLSQAQAQASRKEEVLNALSRLAVQIRTRLGESLSTIRDHSTPLEQATTSSLEALKAYSAGWNTVYSHGSAPAISHFQRAIAIDPQFAMAHADLGFFSWNMGQTALGAEQVRIAYTLVDRVSDRERLYIHMLYDRQVTGNLQKELSTLESWAQTYPRDPFAPGIISGWVARGTGQYERGIQAAQESMRLNPDIPYSHESLALHNTALNRFAEAEAVLQRAAERKLEVPEMLVHRFYLAFFKGDQAGMEREIARAPQEHAEDWMSHNQALVLARSGQMRQARAMWDRAIASAQQAGLPERAAIYESAEAVCEAYFGNAMAAKERAHAALQIAKNRDVEYAAAFALALAGDSAGSQRLAADLENRFPEDTPVQFEYLPTLGALSALARRVPADAIVRLQRAVPFDFALPGTAFFAKFGSLYPAYVRGQAYLDAHQGRPAAAEFQKILDHRGIVFADPVGALAHLQIGRACSLSGENVKAEIAYENFFTLWKDADRDIPILKQAKAEYARLQ